MAQDLGTTQQRISRATLGLEGLGLLKVDHVNGGKRQHNQYQVLVAPAVRIFSRPKESTKPDPRTQYRAQLDKHNEMKIQDNPAACQRQKGAAVAACFNGLPAKKELLSQPERCLSGKANTQELTERYKLLLRHGIEARTAENIAQDERITYKSLCNCVANAYVKHNDSGGLWRPRPGYFVQAINRAIAEGKQISLSQSAAKDQLEKDAALSLVKCQKRILPARPAAGKSSSFEAALKARLIQNGTYEKSLFGSSLEAIG